MVTSRMRTGRHGPIAAVILLSFAAQAGPTVLATASPVAAEAGKLCPHLKSVHIEGAGHNIRREQFEPFVNAVTAFLARV